MTSSDLICTDCLHDKHSHHKARWGGICIGCACAYQPLPEAADGTGKTDSHDGGSTTSPASDAVRDLAAPSNGPSGSRPAPGATDLRIQAILNAGYFVDIEDILAAADAADKAAGVVRVDTRDEAVVERIARVIESWFVPDRLVDDHWVDMTDNARAVLAALRGEQT